MKAVVATLVAVVIGLTFAGATLAQPTPAAPPAGVEMPKEEGKKSEAMAEKKQPKKRIGGERHTKKEEKK